MICAQMYPHWSKWHDHLRCVQDVKNTKRLSVTLYIHFLRCSKFLRLSTRIVRESMQRELL
jgi:hypothetical protein